MCDANLKFAVNGLMPVTKMILVVLESMGEFMTKIQCLVERSFIVSSCVNRQSFVTRVDDSFAKRFNFFKTLLRWDDSLFPVCSSRTCDQPRTPQQDVDVALHLPSHQTLLHANSVGCKPLALEWSATHMQLLKCSRNTLLTASTKSGSNTRPNIG